MSRMDDLKSKMQTIEGNIASKTNDRNTHLQAIDNINREINKLNDQRNQTVKEMTQAQADADAKQKEIDRLAAEKAQIAA